jgi:hypothetical protein
MSKKEQRTENSTNDAATEVEATVSVAEGVPLSPRSDKKGAAALTISTNQSRIIR